MYTHKKEKGAQIRSRLRFGQLHAFRTCSQFLHKGPFIIYAGWRRALALFSDSNSQVVL